MYGCGKDCLILIPCRLPQVSWFTLSLKCFSSDADNCPAVGIRALLHFPHPLRAGPVLLTLLFFPPVPSPYRVLCGSIYSFLLVRYSCLLSDGVLHALLCLEVYSWCSHRDRCTPCPPSPLPPCSLLILSFEPALSLSSFTLIRRLLGSSSLVIRVWSSTIWGCWCFSCLSWFHLVTLPAQHFSWCAQNTD